MLLHHTEECRFVFFFVFKVRKDKTAFQEKSAVLITGARTGSAYESHTQTIAHMHTHTLREAIVNHF